MRYIVYVEAPSIDSIDEALGSAVDNLDIEKYAVLTENGAPILYEEGQDSAWQWMQSMAVACLGITES